MINEDDFKMKPLPTRFGEPLGKSIENRALWKLGGQDGIRTSEPPTGGVAESALLKTGSGLAHFTTEKEKDKKASLRGQFIGYKSNHLMFNHVNSKYKPFGMNYVFSSNLSCDHIFHLRREADTGALVDLTTGKVTENTGTLTDINHLQKYVRVEFKLKTIINMSVNISDLTGQVDTYGNPWHGKIGKDLVLTLDDGVTQKDVAGSLFNPFVYLVDYAPPEITTSDANTLAGGRFDNFALLHGRYKQYGITADIRTDGWLYKTPAGVVWEVWLDDETAWPTLTVKIRPAFSSEKWTDIHSHTMTTVPLQKYPITPIETFSADGARYIKNYMTRWGVAPSHPYYVAFTVGAPSNPYPGAVPEYNYSERASARVIVKLQANITTDIPEIEEFACEVDEWYSENGGSTGAILDYPDMLGAAVSTTPYDDGFSRGVQLYSAVLNATFGITESHYATSFVLFKYVLPDGQIKEVEFRRKEKANINYIEESIIDGVLTYQSDSETWDELFVSGTKVLDRLHQAGRGFRRKSTGEVLAQPTIEDVRDPADPDVAYPYGGQTYSIHVRAESNSGVSYRAATSEKVYDSNEKASRTRTYFYEAYSLWDASIEAVPYTAGVYQHQNKTICFHPKTNEFAVDAIFL